MSYPPFTITHMKGSYKTLFSNGKLHNTIGVNIHCLAEMLLNQEIKEIKLYNDASTEYRRLEDGTWVRTTGVCTTKTVRVEVIDLTPGKTILKQYKIKTGEKVDQFIR